MAARITTLERQQKEIAARERNVEAFGETLKRYNKPVIRTIEDYDKFVVTSGLVSELHDG